MSTNFHTGYSDGVTKFRAADMTPPLGSLDKVITYLKNIIVHTDGDITYVEATGVLTWSGTLRILFNREDGQAIQNTIAAGSITLADNEFFYVDLSETNNAALTASKAAVTTGAASNFLAVARLVLAYRNTASDKLFSQVLPLGSSSPGVSNVVEDTTPQLGGNLDLNGKCVTETFLSSGALSQYDLCYIDANGKLAKTGCDAEATTKGMLVLALAAATGADESIACCVLGKVTTGAWTAGQTLYVSATAGGITATAPTTGQYLRVIGHAVSASVIFFNPSQTWIQVA